MRSIKWQDVGSCSALPRALNNHSRPSSKSAGIRKIPANPSRRHKPSTPRSECHCSSRAMAGSTKHDAQLGLQVDKHVQKTRESGKPPGRPLPMHCGPCLLRRIRSRITSGFGPPPSFSSTLKLSLSLRLLRHAHASSRTRVEYSCLLQSGYPHLCGR
jgi:hypothetical protein